MVDVIAWTDGSCLGNPGPGGWAVLLVSEDTQQTVSGGERDTTNNRMELTAALRAVETAPRESRLVVMADSQYLRDGITKWIHGWKKNGWSTASGQVVKNRDLWVALDQAVAAHGAVTWKWVRGHAGNIMNERVDALAREQAMRHRKS